MVENATDDRPSRPDLPAYVLDPLERQSPEKLDRVAEYATALAAWKRRDRAAEGDRRREREAVGELRLAELRDRGVSTDPEDYEGVPSSKAYVTVKETKPGYRYYYWQWREGDAWKNEYIGPVDPADDSSENGSATD